MGPEPAAASVHRYTFRAMGGECEVQVAGAPTDRLRAAAQSAIDEVRRIERKYSRYRDDSVTSAINRAAGGAAVAIDAETAALLEYADTCHVQSEGRFDLTSGVLRRVWDFRAHPPRVPSSEEIAAVHALVGWTRVERTDAMVRLPVRGMEIDFGGIGKEYAADRAAQACVEQGVRHGLVNLGGDVRVIGPTPDDAPWRIAIRHPRRAGILGYADLREGALATSGDYERCMVVDGTRYAHVLDARTGWPVRHWQSVTVVAPLCILAGSCATIAMLLEQAAPAFLRAQGVRYLAVDDAGRQHGDAMPVLAM